MRNRYPGPFSGLKTVMAAVALLFAIQTIAQNHAINLNRSTTSIEVAKDNSERLQAQFSYPAIYAFTVESEKGTFNELIIPETYSVGAIGTPKLPATHKLIEIPFGADVHVEVINYSMTEYRLADYGIDHAILPVQPSLRKDIDIADVEFEFDETAYAKEGFITPEMAQVEVLGVMRSYRIARLTIAPIAYNPVEGIIRVYNDIEVEVSFTNVDQALTQHIKASTYSPYFDALNKHFLNDPDRDYPNHPDLTKDPIKMVVVADRAFETTLAPFFEWKTEQGFYLIVGYTDEIGTTSAAIKNFIHGHYNAGTPEDPAPTFALIVGGPESIPASDIGSSSGQVTDLYYASVDGDYFPEMYYGRLSARNVQELENQLDKILYYQKYEFTDPTYLNDVTLIAGQDGYWNPQVGQPTINYGTQNYFNAANGFTNVNAYLNSYAGCFDNERISVSLINFTAHCSPTSWAGPYLTVSDVHNLTNTDMYPLAVGNCCQSALFSNTECIGEAWLRAQNKGGVAYIGSAPNTHWFEDFYWSVGAFPIQGNNNGYVPTFEETSIGAYDAPFVSDYLVVDAMKFAGNLAITEANIQGYPVHVSNNSARYYWQGYHTFGDPSTFIYLTEGVENEVAHMAILPIGLDTYTVEALPGSYVGISKDGVLHGAAMVDESGEVEVPLEPILSGGDVRIVVTKHQHIPYIADIPAAALEGPYVVLDGFTINDEEGNDNGLADYSEEISLNISLKNVGADPSADVMATVTGTDDYISLTGEATQNFGPINTDEIVTLDDAYSFAIADYVPDQYQATFVLEITDGSDTWNSNLRITVHAPVLHIDAELTIDDSETGNGDGILDPGETAMALLTLHNTGSSQIADIIANLISNDDLLVINTENITVDQLEEDGSVELEFSITASADSPIGYPVYLQAEAAGGPDALYTVEQEALVVIGLIPDYYMNNETVTTCVGLFYDSGGPDGDYSNNENYTMTFLPAMDNAIIEVDFLAFETESGYDYLYVYDGPNAMSPEFPGSPFHGTTSPGHLVATNESGAITFKFTSDFSVTRSGWEAEISCQIEAGPLEVNPTALPEMICGTGIVQLSANADGGTGSYTCTWEPAESLSDPGIPNPIASPTETTTYTVTVDDGEDVVEGEITVFVHELASIHLGNDTILCAPFDLQLDATIHNGVSYYWEPHGETTPIVTVDSTGTGFGTVTYHVIVTDENGCEIEDSINITFDPCTFLTEKSGEVRMSVHPNPAQSVINLIISGYGDEISYHLLNYQGQVVHAQLLGKLSGHKQQQIDVSTYAKGIYYLRLNTQTDIIVKKIVIN